MKDSSGVFTPLKLELNLKKFEVAEELCGISRIKSTGLISLNPNWVVEVIFQVNVSPCWAVLGIFCVSNNCPLSAPSTPGTDQELSPS